MSAVHLQLPYPPSVNRYWRHVAGRTLISRDGRAYRRRILEMLRPRPAPFLEGRLSLVMTACAPDRRRRDLDNLPKALLDALQHAGVYRDDSQIDQLTVSRGDVCPPDGFVRVQIYERQDNP